MERFVFRVLDKGIIRLMLRLKPKFTHNINQFTEIIDYKLINTLKWNDVFSGKSTQIFIDG